MTHARPETKQALLDAAATLLARNPSVSLAEIARAAGVGRATLHRWFPSGQDLRRELALDALAACDQATADIAARVGSAREALCAVIAALIPLGDRFRFLVHDASALEDPVVKQASDRQMAELAQLIVLAKQEGVIDVTVPTAWAVSAFDMLIYTAWQGLDRGDIARNDAAALVERTLFSGLG